MLLGAVIGALLRRLLPDHHLDDHARDIIRLGAGLVGTIAALVLGLLINSANSSYEAQRGEIRQIAANLILLDAVLDQYGPEANPTRVLLRVCDRLRLWRR
jgi:fluoride ion exporter CrcB/FEX